jgi:hypothetical protein
MGLKRRSRLDAAIFVVASCSIELGCATLQPIHASPTPSEIAEINESGSSIVVEPLMIPPLGGHSWTVDHIVFADAQRIVVAPDDGPAFAFRVGEVANFHVRRTGHGAAVGGAIGAAIGAIGGLAAGFVVSRMGDPGPPARTPTPGPSAGSEAGAYLAIAAVGALAYGSFGALIGTITGAPEDFPVIWTAPPFPVAQSMPAPIYDAPAPPVSRPSPPAPAPRGAAAIVVSASAAVRSAPFTVAPVVVVLAQGTHLFVDETPRAGWRVAYLSDGRVGYVEDARIKPGAP